MENGSEVAFGQKDTKNQEFERANWAGLASLCKKGDSIVAVIQIVKLSGLFL
jgi:hypothetical protein